MALQESVLQIQWMWFSRVLLTLFKDQYFSNKIITITAENNNFQHFILFFFLCGHLGPPSGENAVGSTFHSWFQKIVSPLYHLSNDSFKMSGTHNTCGVNIVDKGSKNIYVNKFLRINNFFHIHYTYSRCITKNWEIIVFPIETKLCIFLWKREKQIMHVKFLT